MNSRIAILGIFEYSALTLTPLIIPILPETAPIISFGPSRITEITETPLSLYKALYSKV